LKVRRSPRSSSVNRDEVRDCGNVLGKLVPLISEVMMDIPKTLWGDAVYPVVEEGKSSGSLQSLQA
jgi:hypothetical protein